VSKRAFINDFKLTPECHRLEQAVKDDVALIKGSKLVPDHITVTGYIYDVKTGKVNAV
jgi:carbonic anhydrase